MLHVLNDDTVRVEKDMLCKRKRYIMLFIDFSCLLPRPIQSESSSFYYHECGFIAILIYGDKYGISLKRIGHCKLHSGYVE